jgi:hypothetical protein
MHPCLMLPQVRYTRCNNNPSQVVLGEKIAELEGEIWSAAGGSEVQQALHVFSVCACVCVRAGRLIDLLDAGP